MSRLSYHFLALFFLLAVTTFTAAQEMTPAEAEALKASDKQAFEFLETIAEGIPSLRAFENRIYLTNAVADLLWSKDEKRARGLFDAVTREMVAAVAAYEPSDQERYNDQRMIQQQRQDTIDRMANHDPEMAMAFLRATRFPVTSESTQYRANETELEFHLAAMIAERDPAQALRVARNSLRKGIPYSIVQVLSQIHAKDRNSAQSLHAEIVDRLKTEELSRNHEVVNNAWNLLNSYRPPEAKEETYRELIELMVGAALTVNPRDSASISLANNFYYQLRSAVPQIEKYVPGRLPAVRQWIERVQRTQDPGTRMYQEINDLAEKGTIDDILALAGKYGPELQTQIYQQAVGKALSSGEPNRAQQIISEFVTDPAQRRQMLEQLDNQLAWNSVQGNQIAETRRRLSRIKRVEQRANLLMSLAMNVASAGNKKQGLDLLTEARALLDSSPLDSSTLISRLQLAQNYSSLDSEEGVALLESIIMRMNQLVAAAAVLDGFEDRYLKDGEWLKANHTNLGNLVRNLTQNIGELARRDPTSARYLSNKLERPEIRLMAQLEIVQSLLGGVEQTHPTLTGRSVRINLK